ncbi:MAG: NAD+ synthase [Armatimonadota bacterium]|nr:NAD+ synthase [bacterium]
MLRLALAQLNMTVGDIDGNTRRIIENIDLARERGADIVVFPELAVTGYPPEDLLLKQNFVDDNMDAIQRIAAATQGITAIVGFVDVAEDIYNAAAILHNGRIAGIQHKFYLPNYGVFDEDRYFQAGMKTSVYTLGDVTFGVEVCEDAWYAGGPHSQQALVGGAQIIIGINSSPFHAGKWRYRERMLGARATDNTCVFVYLNAVGGQDELVFDGHSLVVGPSGNVEFRCKAFEEQLAIVDVDLGLVMHQRLVDPRRRKAKLRSSIRTEVPEVVLEPVAAVDRNGNTSVTSQPPSDVEEVYSALVMGTRDYVNKNGFKEVVLGMSGGIDSAITACVAVDALGADRVRVLIMPSMFSSDATQSDAQKAADNLGIRADWIAISDIFDSYNRALSEVFKGTEHGVAEENLQARIRGNLLMALSNKFNLLVLTTGNKSEMACGYSTLYGDMAGGFAVIKDVPKTLVYKLANYRNTISPVIPETIITRPPSAELKPNQTDQDTLPPYEILDPIIEAYVQEDRGIREIAAMGYDEEIVRRVIRMVDRNEYKRRQAAPGVKITPKAFGRDRRLPITNRYRE